MRTMCTRLAAPAISSMPQQARPIGIGQMELERIQLITASVRRFRPDMMDPKIHHNNLIQSILAKIEANHAGADDNFAYAGGVTLYATAAVAGNIAIAWHL